MKEVPEWLSKGMPRPTKRKAVISFKFYEKDSPLMPSGLMGPVLLRKITADVERPSVEEELLIPHNRKPIYGVLSTPDNDRARHPVVIVAHGFNGSYHFGRNYFRMLNELGYMCYTFDFPCGGLRSRTDNNTVNMSLVDEQKALERIVRYFQKRPDVDKRNIVLVGGSQGGLIAALTAARMKKDIKKLILEFPALSIPDNWNSRYAQTSDIPDTTHIWKVPVGKRFFMELRDMDPFQSIGDYKRPVLLVHGDADNIVPVEYSRRAVQLYEDAQLYEIPKAGHGFKGKDFKYELELMKRFLTEEP